VSLNEDATPLVDKREYKLSLSLINKKDLASKTLVFFENELNIENLNLKKYQNIYCILLNNEKRKIKLDEKVINFKKKIIEDQVSRFSNIKIVDEIAFDKLTNDAKNLDIVYPSVGENLSFLKSIQKRKNLNYNFIVREVDEFCWQFSNKGYFNFKLNIPKIIQKIT
jgi:hypothetical protein